MSEPKIFVSILLESNGELGVVDVESSEETGRDDGEEAGEGFMES